MTPQLQVGQEPIVSPESVSEIINASPDPLESSPNQIKKTAKQVIGALHTLAIVEGIKPPEAAIDRLPEDEQHAALDLFETATDPSGDKPKKPLEPATADRIGRVLTYFAGEEERIAS